MAPLRGFTGKALEGSLKVSDFTINRKHFDVRPRDENKTASC